MSRLSATDLPLDGLKLVKRFAVSDQRGAFSRLFCADELRAAGWIHPVGQINHAVTAKRGSIRGMHFQFPPKAEMKLVTCIRGAVLDVAVDIRKNSATFLSVCSAELSPENGNAMLIPEGFAHGFQALTDDVELIYCHSALWSPDHEGGINPYDSLLGINWPLPVSDISERDAMRTYLSQDFKGVDL